MIVIMPSSIHTSINLLDKIFFLFLTIKTKIDKIDHLGNGAEFC